MNHVKTVVSIWQDRIAALAWSTVQSSDQRTFALCSIAFVPSTWLSHWNNAFAASYTKVSHGASVLTIFKPADQHAEAGNEVLEHVYGLAQGFDLCLQPRIIHRTHLQITACVLRVEQQLAHNVLERRSLPKFGSSSFTLPSGRVS